jgi:hypothetical protein
MGMAHFAVNPPQSGFVAFRASKCLEATFQPGDFLSKAVQARGNAGFVEQLKTSELLSGLARNGTSLRITVAEIVEALGNRGFALLLVVLGLPNCLPMPPPIPLIAGLLILFVGVQMLIGLRRPWLPKRVLAYSATRESTQKLMSRAAPWLQKMERFARPRFGIMSTDLGFRINAILVLVFAVALLFALPFIGQIPLGIAICLIGLGMVERDGALTIAACFFGAIGLFFSIGFVLAVLAGAMRLLNIM